MCSSDLAKEGVAIDYLRVRAFPFHDDVRKFLDSHDAVFIVEQNRDGQLRNLLTLETGVPMAKMHSIRYYGGFPLSARHVVEPIIEQVPPELLRGGTKTQDSRRTVVSDTWE